MFLAAVAYLISYETQEIAYSSFLQLRKLSHIKVKHYRINSAFKPEKYHVRTQKSDLLPCCLTDESRYVQ